MITAPEDSFLGYVCEQVDRLKPNESLCFSASQMKSEISSYQHNGATFTPPDRVLGNIVGSAFKHSYHIDFENDLVEFRRHEDTRQRRFTDPDRR